jgi:hypothetical protein
MRKRPHRSASKPGDEVPPFHSITLARITQFFPARCCSLSVLAIWSSSDRRPFLVLLVGFYVDASARPFGTV